MNIHKKAQTCDFRKNTFARRISLGPRVHIYIHMLYHEVIVSSEAHIENI